MEIFKQFLKILIGLPSPNIIVFMDAKKEKKKNKVPISGKTEKNRVAYWAYI